MNCLVMINRDVVIPMKFTVRDQFTASDMQIKMKSDEMFCSDI